MFGSCFRTLADILVSVAVVVLFCSCSGILHFESMLTLICAFCRLSRKKEKLWQICQCLNSVDSAVAEKVCGVQLCLCTEVE